MPEFIAPLLPEYSIQPSIRISLVGWLVWLVVLVGIAVRNRDRQFVLDRASLAWLALLSVLLLIFTPFLGVPIQIGGSVGAPHLMFLAALPWMAAGGLLGMVPSILLGRVIRCAVGVFGYPFDLYTAVLHEHCGGFSPSLFGKNNKVSYFGYYVFRRSLLAAGAVMFPLTFLGLFLGSEGDLAASMVSSLNQFLPVYLSLVGMALLGGVGCLVVKLVTGERWVGSMVSAEKESTKQNLGLRYVLIALPLAIVLLVATVAGQWKSAREFARRSIVEEMTTAAQSVGDGMADILAEGEAAVQQAAAGLNAAQLNTENAQLALEAQWAGLSNFDRVALTGSDGTLLAVYPLPEGDEAFPTNDEQNAIISNLSWKCRATGKDWQ